MNLLKFHICIFSWFLRLIQVSYPAVYTGINKTKFLSGEVVTNCNVNLSSTKEFLNLTSWQAKSHKKNQPPALYFYVNNYKCKKYLIQR